MPTFWCHSKLACQCSAVEIDRAIQRLLISRHTFLQTSSALNLLLLSGNPKRDPLASCTNLVPYNIDMVMKKQHTDPMQVGHSSKMSTKHYVGCPHQMHGTPALFRTDWKIRYRVLAGRPSLHGLHYLSHFTATPLSSMNHWDTDRGELGEDHHPKASSPKSKIPAQGKSQREQP